MTEKSPTDDELIFARKVIIKNLDRAKKNLYLAREACKSYPLWDTGYLGNELDDILCWLEGLIVPIVIHLKEKNCSLSSLGRRIRN
jgi:hypothetical protein